MLLIPKTKRRGFASPGRAAVYAYNYRIRWWEGYTSSEDGRNINCEAFQDNAIAGVWQDFQCCQLSNKVTSALPNVSTYTHTLGKVVARSVHAAFYFLRIQLIKSAR